MNNKEELAARFKECYPGKRLLSIKLDGFSHAVFFDDGTQTQYDPYEVERHTCASEQNIHERANKLFQGHPHYMYQNNAKQYLYVAPTKR